jgi:hypothetical protein
VKKGEPLKALRRMRTEQMEELEKVKQFVVPANEENIDRLTEVVRKTIQE